VIARQLLEAGTSIGANVDEARCAYSRREFACKNSIALKESRETSYWLRLIDACELAPRAELEPLRSEAREISAILAAIVKKARTPKEPGRT
jgi:four helix bundle protein